MAIKLSNLRLTDRKYLIITGDVVAFYLLLLSPELILAKLDLFFYLYLFPWAIDVSPELTCRRPSGPDI